MELKNFNGDLLTIIFYTLGPISSRRDDISSRAKLRRSNKNHINE